MLFYVKNWRSDIICKFGDLIIFKSEPHVFLTFWVCVKNDYHKISANIKNSVVRIVSYFNKFQFIAVLCEKLKIRHSLSLLKLIARWITFLDTIWFKIYKPYLTFVVSSKLELISTNSKFYSLIKFQGKCFRYKLILPKRKKAMPEK